MMVEEKVRIEGKGLHLEGVLNYRQDCRGRGGALICSPHPLLGGDMDNNVVEALARGIAEEDVVSLRFNYRGVGQSRADGEVSLLEEKLAAFWEDSISLDDPQKVDDALAALEFLRKVLIWENAPLSVMGYSFGAYVASEVVRQVSKVSSLVLVSPTLGHNDFAHLRCSQVPKMIIVSEDDFAYALSDAEAFFSVLPSPKEMKLFTGGNHFFLGQEPEVTQAVKEFLAINCFDFRAWG